MKKDQYHNLITLGCLSVLFAYLLLKSWLRWGDLIIDTSRELWLPTQIVAGKRLYADVFYPYGFLPVYIIALLYKIFGAHILCAVITGILVTGCTTYFLYLSAGFFLDRLGAACVAATFLVVFAFGCYQRVGLFNFILPYSLASTLFVAFLAAGLYFFLAFIRGQQRRSLTAWVGFMGLAAFCRLELFLFVFPAFIAALLVYRLRAPAARSRGIVWFAAAALGVSAAGYILVLFPQHSARDFWQGLTGYIRINLSNEYSQKILGTDSLGSRILNAGLSFLIQLGVFSLCVGFARLARTRPARISWAVALGVIAIAVSLKVNYGIIYNQYICAPWIVLGLFCVGLFRLWRKKYAPENLMLTVLSAVAILMVARIFFIASALNYGFFLLPLAMVSYYVFFLRCFPDYLASRFVFDRQSYSLFAVIVSLAMLLPYGKTSLEAYSQRTILAVTDKGTYISRKEERSMVFWSAVAYLRDNTPADSRLVVFPEGVSINFFAGRTNPLSYYCFLPQDIRLIGESNLLARLAATAPEYVAVAHRVTSEYGYPFFGQDYARGVGEWIFNNYNVERVFGVYPFTSDQFGIAIWRRK